MKGVRTVVDGQLILFAVQRELSTADTVAVSSDECRQKRLWAVNYILDIVVSLNNVGNFSILIGHHDCYNGSTVVGDCNLISESVSQYVQIGFLSVDSGLKVFTLQATEVFCFNYTHNKISF